MTQFQSTISLLRGELKKGELDTIAQMADVSKQTVLNTLRKTSTDELTETQRKVINAMRTLISNRRADAENLQRSLDEFANGTAK